MSTFDLSADDQGYSRELKTRRDPRGDAKPAWPIDVIGDVIAECERENAAITQGQILESVDDVWHPLPWAEGAPRDDVLLDDAGSSAWKCWREEGEPWDAFVARCAAWAREMVAQLAGSARYDSTKTLIVDIAWVTPDELTLFDLPSHVSHALARSLDDGSAFRVQTYSSSRARCARPEPGSYYGDPAVDIGTVPANARFLHAPLTAKGAPKLGRLHELVAFSTSGLTDKTSPHLQALTGLRVLSTSSLRIKSLDALRALTRLQVLNTDVCLQLTDWSALEGMPDLRVLRIGELKLPDLSALGRLRQLRGLYFYVDRAVESLAPLAALTELRSLRFWGGALDGSLEPLAALRNLRTLDLRTQSFKLEAFAALAAALPNTDGPHRSPFVSAVGWQRQIVRCPKCGASAAYYTLGKPTRLLCENCDAAPTAAYVAQWEILVSAARARQARAGRIT